MTAAVLTLEPKSLAILFKEMICLGLIVIELFISNKCKNPPISITKSTSRPSLERK
ncbi:hypothetical protein ES708_32662 [subsurface metagenome]